MIFEIGNPIEPYTIESDRVSVACVAVIYLGDTKYSLLSKNGRKLIMPAFWGRMNETAADWFWSNYEQDIYEFFCSNREAIAKCLESVLVGTLHDREIFMAADELMAGKDARARWRERWHHFKRTSPLIDITTTALYRATELRTEDDLSVVGMRVRRRCIACG